MLSTLIRTVIIYIVITAAIRIMGKRQIGDMQPNELVITLLISEIAAIPLQDANQPVINGIAAISVLVVAEVLLSALAMKSGPVRRLLGGKAVILIKNGEIDQNALKRVRVTADDLLEMLRGKDVFDINEVDFAILEVNGELNVFKKEEYQQVTKKDMKIPSSKEEPFLPVIIDGSVQKDNCRFFSQYGKQDIKTDNKAQRKDIFLLLRNLSGRQICIKKEKKQ